MVLSAEQLNAFASLIGQAVSSHMAGNPKAGNSQVHEVVRRVKGKRKKVQTTLPQLLAELNDHLEDVCGLLDEGLENADNVERKKRKGKRKSTVVVDG